jgi:sugar/nucleoside kinase (ribokinase family)
VSAPARTRATLLCVGDAFDDLIFTGLRRLPKLGEEVKTPHFAHTFGGGALITAVAAARLGLKVRLMSAVSPGASVRLEREGVSVRNLLRAGESHAITAALSTARDRALVTYDGVNPRLDPRFARALRHVRVTHVHLAFVPTSCASWARHCRRLRRRGISTSWDFGFAESLLNDREFTQLIDALDFVFVNELEAGLYAGARTLTSALRWWRARSALPIVRLGPRGSRWVTPRGDLHVPALRVRVIDTTGAGDAFNAGFLVAWLSGRSPRACLEAGNRTGAASTRRPGGLDGLPPREK